MQAKTIDEVILILDKIVEDCKLNNNPLGYFAVLYRKVTVRVKEGILMNRFENNTQMEMLDVNFANRYFEAYFGYKSSKQITNSWKVAFDSSKKSYLVMQYLFQGINAHINLDLGIATIKTIEERDVSVIKNDFYAINELLSEMVDGVKKNIGEISPLFKIVMPLAKKWDDKLAQFSIELARDGAWEFAQQLKSTSDVEKLIANRDNKISLLGAALVAPSRVLGWMVKTVLLFESGSVRKNIELLEQAI